MRFEGPFGLWLKQTRKTQDLTQEELADCAGCSIEMIRKIEAGGRRPSRDVAERLADCLSVPVTQRASFVQFARAEAPVSSPQPVPAEPDIRTLRQAPERPRAALPVQPTPFIGRETELGEVGRLLADPLCRLITVVGPGGMGKTRLALQAAAAQEPAFADGVYFVPLASVSSAELIVPAIADALGFVFSGRADSDVQLLHYLREKELLLVLDNFEHLLDGAGLLVDLLRQAPAVKLLVTSRERLSLQEEWVFELQGLPVPASAEVVDLDRYSAVTLFEQRAQRARAGFHVGAEEREDVVRICQLVDGMPLGIELAAAWMRVLPCHEIAQEIERNLDFLEASLRDVPERHRSLRAVFDHSWALLTPEERRVLAKLSVFRGGFGREAAEQVAAASLRLLSALVDKSLLRRVAGRYDLHELVRQYAAVKLQNDPQEYATTLDRHSSYYAAFLDQREAPLKSARQQAAIQELSVEIDNIRSAWDWAVTCRRASDIRRSVESLFWFYELHSWFQEGATVFRRAVEALSKDAAGPLDASPGGAHGPEADGAMGHTIALGQVLTSYGYFLSRLGQLGEARDVLQRSATLLRRTDDRKALGDAIVYSGIVTYQMGEYAEARQLHQEGIAVAGAIGDRWNVALALFYLAMTAQARGEYTEAQSWFRESITVWRTLGNPRGLTLSLSFFSATLHALGEYDEAQRLLHESLVLSSETNDRWGLATTLHHLGLVNHALGNFAEAQYMLRESLLLSKEIGNPWDVVRVLNHLGATYWALGAFSQARNSFLEALRTAMEAKALPDALDALVWLATLLANDGTKEQALKLLNLALQHPAIGHQTKDRAERLRAEIASGLPQQKLAEADRQVTERPFEAVVAEILPTITL